MSIPSITIVGVSLVKTMEGSEGARTVTNIMYQIGVGADLIQVTEALAGVGAPSLDAQIAKAEEKAAYWQKAIDEYIEAPDSEGGFIGEALMKNYWDHRHAKLLQKKGTVS